MKVGYIIISSVLVLILSTLIFYFSNKQETEPELNESFCEKIRFIPLNDVCHISFSKDIDSCKDVEKGYDLLCYEIVVDALDVSEGVCENIENNYGKFLCYLKLAIELEDPEFCEGNFNCYTELAVLTKDYDICDYIGFDAEIYKCLAKASGDRDYCNEIDDEIERKSCEGVIPEEVSDCEIGDYYNYDCLFELAYNERNSTICDLISSEEWKWTCVVDVEDDPEVCDDAPTFFEDLCRIEYLRNHLRK